MNGCSFGRLQAFSGIKHAGSGPPFGCFRGRPLTGASKWLWVKRLQSSFDWATVSLFRKDSLFVPCVSHCLAVLVGGLAARSGRTRKRMIATTCTPGEATWYEVSCCKARHEGYLHHLSCLAVRFPQLVLPTLSPIFTPPPQQDFLLSSDSGSDAEVPYEGFSGWWTSLWLVFSGTPKGNRSLDQLLFRISFRVRLGDQINPNNPSGPRLGPRRPPAPGPSGPWRGLWARPRGAVTTRWGRRGLSCFLLRGLWGGVVGGWGELGSPFCSHCRHRHRYQQWQFRPVLETQEQRVPLSCPVQWLNM